MPIYSKIKNNLMNLYYKIFIRTAEENANYLKKYSGAKIGENCHIFKSVSFGSEPYLITIGNNVTITSGVKILTHDGGIKVPMKMGLVENADIFGKINIGDNVFIGVDCIIMPGVKIGCNCIIGAGSVVTKTVPDNSVVAGVPIKQVCTIFEYYEKNKHRIFFTDNLLDEEKEKVVKDQFSKRPDLDN